MDGGTPKPPPRLELSLFPIPIPPLKKPPLNGFALIAITSSSDPIGVALIRIASSSNPIGVTSMMGQEDWSQMEHSSNQITPSGVKVGAAVRVKFQAVDQAINRAVKAGKVKSWYKINMSRANPSCMPMSSHVSSLYPTTWTFHPWDPGPCVDFGNSTKGRSLGFRIRRSILCSFKLSVQASRRDEIPARLGE